MSLAISQTLPKTGFIDVVVYFVLICFNTLRLRGIISIYKLYMYKMGGGGL